MIDATSHEDQSEIIKDLLNTLFARLEAVIQGHVTILDFLRSRGEDTIRSQLYTIQDVWIATKDEIKSFLLDYLISQERQEDESAPLLAINEIMAEKGRKRKDRNKVAFFGL